MLTFNYDIEDFSFNSPKNVNFHEERRIVHTYYRREHHTKKIAIQAGEHGAIIVCAQA